MKKILLIFSIVLFTAGFTTNLSAQTKGKDTVTFNVSMHCGSCEQKIKNSIRFEKGVTGIKTDLEAQTVEIMYKTDKTDKDKLAEALIKLGYKPEDISNSDKN